MHLGLLWSTKHCLRARESELIQAPSLSRGYNFPGVGDTFISPQQLRNAMDTAGTETWEQSTQGTLWSTQTRSEPWNSVPQHMWSAEELLPETSPGMEQENSRESLFRSVLARNLNPRDPMTAPAWATEATTAAKGAHAQQQRTEWQTFATHHEMLTGLSFPWIPLYFWNMSKAS